MTIDKAIEILEDLTSLELLPEERKDAIKLGIEALRRLKEGRFKGYDFFGHKLPGETKKKGRKVKDAS